MDATAQSDRIEEDGSGTYTGKISDFAQLTYSTWNIRAVAYPDMDNSDYTASKEASVDYVLSGAVDYGTPTLGYMWSLTSGELEIKVADMDYAQTAYPTDVTVTLTNEADSSDVITVDITDIDSSSATAATADAKADATYQMSADFEWDPEYVSNPSYTLEDGEAVTSSEMNTISGDFYYSSSIYKAFNFPHVCENFDPEKGGSAGYWYNDGSESGGGMMPGMQSSDTDDEEEEDDSVYFEATPIDPVDGAEYSYDILATSPSGSITATPKLSPGGASTKRIFGELDINSDGTFKMTIEYQYIKTDPMNSAVYYVPATECDGTYTTNADGTLNLSYDHENAFELDYDIVTEKTGRALKWAEENPELAAQEEEEANQMSGGGPGGMPGGPDADAGDGSADAPAEEGTDAATEAPAEAGTAPAPEG